MSWPDRFTSDVHQRLLAPFPEGIVQWREQKFAYIEARDVMMRLDDVVGPGNWSFEIEPLRCDQRGVSVLGKLTVLGVLKSDAGEYLYASERDKMEPFKAAASDALKRAAVHFGIARYLYELEVKRNGQITPAEAEAAARRAGYTPDPAVHDFPCSICGADVDYDLARKCQRTYGGRVFCVKHKAELDEGVKAQQAVKAADEHYCAQCGDSVPPHIAAISLQKFGLILCVPDGQARVKAEKAKRAEPQPVG